MISRSLIASEILAKRAPSRTRRPRARCPPSLESSSGRVADAAVQAADEEHPGRDAGRARGPPRRGRRRRRARARRARPRAAPRAARRSSRPARAGAAGLEADRARRARRAASAVRRPRVDADGHARRDDVRRRPARPRARPTVATVAVAARARARAGRTRAASTSASSRASIGVVPAWSARPSKTTSPRAWPTIAVTIPSGSPARCEHRALLDVQLDERRRGSAARRTRGCPIRPVSSSRKATTASGASAAAPRPRAPRRRRARRRSCPPFGTESRCEPLQTVRAPRRPSRLPAASTRDLEPGLPHPARRRARARRPPRASTRRGAARSRRSASSRSTIRITRNARSTRQPASGNSATTAKPTRHDVAATSTPKRPGYAAPGTFSSVCWSPIAAPLRPLPASSTAAAKERPFQLIETTPAATSTGMTSGSGAVTSAAVAATSTAAVSAIARSGPIRHARTSDQRPAPIRPPIASSCITASTAAAPAVGQPSALVQDRGRRSRRRRAAAPARASCRARASRSGGRGTAPGPTTAAASSGRGPSRSTRPPTAAPARQARPSVAKPHAGPPACTTGGNRERDHEAAGRDRRLPDSQCEPTLGGREPVHHGATARRLHACTGGARGREQQAERPEPVRGGGAEQPRPAAGEPGDQDDALAETVGGEPPRDQAGHGAHERARDQQPRLAEREVVTMPQGRRHHGDAEPDRRVRRLRERSRSEDGVAVASYRPNGFVGREPV